MTHELTIPASPRAGAPEPFAWLRPVVAALVVLFTLLSLLDLGVAYVTASMPASHFVAVPIALGLIVITWLAELAGVPWPRLIFVAIVTTPNLWLAAIGHNDVNFLFLLLTVGWVTYRGDRKESLITLGVNLTVVGVGALMDVANGRVALGAWIPWALGLVLVWVMIRALISQHQLMAENARLSEQAKQTALLEERQRLARELHDAVTQTLFSSSLIADVLPRIWERDPAEGQRRLEEMRELTRGALAEMRTLLFELRPAALVEVPLGDLLRQLVEATIGRTRLPVALAVDGSRPLPPEVQIAFYRIAQEALNNVAKHAGAAHAELSLVYRADDVELRVRDDGQGFDPSQVPPGHLGVGIMGERAASAGAALEIESRPGNGTRVSVIWPQNGGIGRDA